MLMRERVGYTEQCVCEHRCDRPIPCKGIDMRLELKAVEGYSVAGGLLCDVIGSGKTATVLALIAQDGSSTAIPPAKRRSEKIFSTRATLVICPANVHSQWLAEVRKFCPSALRVVSVQTVSDLQVDNGASFSELMGADLVLAPFEVLGESAEMENKTEQLKLEAMCWHRIVMDEFHELSSDKNPINVRSPRLRQALCDLHVSRRWGLSGTPESFMNSAASLVRAVQYFGCNVSIRTAPAFVEQFCRQARITLPLPEEHLVHVKLTTDEQYLYLQQVVQIWPSVPRNLEWAHVQQVDNSKLKQLLLLCSDFKVQNMISTGPDAEFTKRPDEVCGDLVTQKDMVASATEENLLRARAYETFLALCNDMRDILLSHKGRSANLSQDVLPNIEDEENATNLLLDMFELFEKLAMFQEEHDQLKREEARERWGMDFWDRKREREHSARELEFAIQQGAGTGPTESEKQLMTGMLSHVVDVCVQIDRLIGRESKGSMAPMLKSYPHRSLGLLLQNCREALRLRRDCDFFEKPWRLLRGEGTEAIECPVCLDNIQEYVCVLYCGHMLCGTCSEKVFPENCPPQSWRCPFCRSEVSAGKMIRGTRLPTETERAHGPRAHWSSKLRCVVTTFEGIRAEDPGAKVIVFAQWDSLRLGLSKVLKEIGIPHLLLGGSVFERTRALQEFQHDNDIPLLLLSLDDSASGTNLTCASHVFLLHPMLAPSISVAASYEAQAIGRVRRLGQSRPVHVWRFVTLGSVEESLRALIPSSVDAIT